MHYIHMWFLCSWLWVKSLISLIFMSGSISSHQACGTLRIRRMGMEHGTQTSAMTNAAQRGSGILLGQTRPGWANLPSANKKKKKTIQNKSKIQTIYKRTLPRLADTLQAIREFPMVFLSLATSNNYCNAQIAFKIFLNNLIYPQSSVPILVGYNKIR